MSENVNPIRQTDDDARRTAARILCDARVAALAFRSTIDGAPMVSRIAVALDAEGCLVSLISDLAQHTRALRQDGRAALLLGETSQKGDPLNHPRLSLRVDAAILPPAAPGHDKRRAAWLARHPKSALYVDFTDFHFVTFRILGGFLNAGFAKAYELCPNDLKVI